uniref:Uncharacterized protein n=1 Tax=Rangifer tarandus platyrhynchus TaxID=3082113 RepID=A0ACB0FIW8_RANTA|nr:unnamed protein product [Rangifer tarandus platyrhynchus]
MIVTTEEGTGYAASEIYDERPIPSQRVQPQRGCAAQARPSPCSQAPAWSVPANQREELRLLEPEGGLKGSLSPDGAQPCRHSRPGKAHSLLLRHLLPNPAEPPRPPSAGLAGPAFASGFRWRRGRADRQGGGVSAAQGRHFCPFVSMAGGWEDSRGRTPGNFQDEWRHFFWPLWPCEVLAVPFHRVGTFWGNSCEVTVTHPETARFPPRCPGIDCS